MASVRSASARPARRLWGATQRFRISASATTARTTRNPEILLSSSITQPSSPRLFSCSRDFTDHAAASGELARISPTDAASLASKWRIDLLTPGSHLVTRLCSWNEIFHHCLAHQVRRQQSLSKNEVVEFFLIEFWAER